NEKGISELMEAKNFDTITGFQSKEYYKKYLAMIGSLNPNVKNKQFHAILSAKGNKHSFEELKNYAKEYINFMGYEKNPYLIYGHRDTKNNHVHIVSTRVDKQGNKIDDTYEYIRSQQFLKQVLKVDYGSNYEALKNEALSYQFSTVAQFKLLLEKHNYKLNDKDDQILVFKSGYRIDKISMEVLHKKIKSYSDHLSHRKKYKAIFEKYADGKHIEEFKNIIHEKFGMEIIFHTAKKKKYDPLKERKKQIKQTPYGYTVIDHKNKVIFKGSEIYSLRNLLEAEKHPLKREEIYPIIEGLLNKNISFSQLKFKLKEFGYSLDGKGNIKINNTTTKITSLDINLLRKLKYNDRINIANSYHYSENSNVSILSKLFFVKSSDLDSSKGTGKIDFDFYKNLFQNIVHQNNIGIEESLKNEKMKIVKFNNAFYLIDFSKKVMVNINKDLGLDFKLKQHIYSDLSKTNIHQIPERVLKINYNSSQSYLNFFEDIFYYNEHEGEEQRRKRKRKL
ncbi:MAG: relaxase/mobilization nuclease domain-containing protein, partial [Flavobacteriaceae bacterium]|nr:relaxase/mobilization nuclease domain-containing protein [Flavobacteriaceae bacterium]